MKDYVPGLYPSHLAVDVLPFSILLGRPEGLSNGIFSLLSVGTPFNQGLLNPDCRAFLWRWRWVPAGPDFVFIEVKNRTNRIIDTEGFQEKIRTLLIKNCMGKIYFLDRAAINEILEERKMEQVGMTTAGRSTGKMYGADYFLAGSIHSINRIQGTQKTAYTRYSFRLTDADTSLIVWEDEYETRYFKEKAFWDQ